MNVGSVCTKYVWDNVGGPSTATITPAITSRWSFTRRRRIAQARNAIAIGISALTNSAVYCGLMPKAHFGPASSAGQPGGQRPSFGSRK